MLRRTARKHHHAQSASLRIETLEDRCVLSVVGALDSLSQLLVPPAGAPASADVPDPGNGSAHHGQAPSQTQALDEPQGSLTLSLLGQTLSLQVDQPEGHPGKPVATPHESAGLLKGLLDALDILASALLDGASTGPISGAKPIDSTATTDHSRRPMSKGGQSGTIDAPVGVNMPSALGGLAAAVGQDIGVALAPAGALDPAAPLSQGSTGPDQQSVTSPTVAVTQASGPAPASAAPSEAIPSSPVTVSQPAAGAFAAAARATAAAHAEPALLGHVAEFVRGLAPAPEDLESRLLLEGERIVDHGLASAQPEGARRAEAAAATIQPPVVLAPPSLEPNQTLPLPPAPAGNVSPVPAGLGIDRSFSTPLANAVVNAPFWEGPAVLSLPWAGTGAPAERADSAALASDEAVAQPAAKLPGSAGLVAGAVPADLAALQRALEEFLGQLDATDRDLTRSFSEPSWTSWAVAFALGAVALEVARRRVQCRRRADLDDEVDVAALSWVSGSWTFEAEES